MDHPVLLMLVKVTIFTLMLAIGVNLSFQQHISLWRRPGLMFRSLLAVIVLVPVFVAVLLWLFELSSAVATGLAVLAAAPGAPLTHKRVQMAGGNMPYAASLQLSLALLAVLVTPLTLAVFHALFELGSERVDVLEVARQVALVQLLPVSIGLLIQHFRPQLASAIGKPLTILAHVLFLLLVVLALVPGLRMTVHLGAQPVVAIVLMVVGCLAIGHLLGGPTFDERTGLAIASVARNIGLALFICALSEIEKEVIPTLLSYMILGAIVAIPYSVWCKRQKVQVGKIEHGMDSTV